MGELEQIRQRHQRYLEEEAYTNARAEIARLKAELDFLRKKDAATEQRLAEERIIARHLEREACAVLAEDFPLVDRLLPLADDNANAGAMTGQNEMREYIADAIRARSTKETSVETKPTA